MQAERLGRFLIAATVAAVVLAVYPYSALPTVDVKWLVIGIGACAAVVTTAWSSRAAIAWGAPPVAVFALNLGWMLIATSAAANEGVGVVELCRQSSYFLLFLAATVVYRTPQQLQRLLTVFVLAMGLVSVYGLVQRAGWDPLPWDPALLNTNEYKHLPSTLGNPNVAGHALILGIIAAGCLCLLRRHRWAIFILALNVTHLLLTRHRAGFVALAAVLVLVFVICTQNPTRTPMRRAVRALVVCIVIGCAGIAALGALHYATRGTVLPREHSLLLRANSFYGSAQMALDYPLLGVGPGNFEIANAAYRTPYEQEYYSREGRFNTHPHNEYLNFAAESGFLSAGLYIAFLVAMMLRGALAYLGATDKQRRWVGLLCACMFFAFAVDSLFGFNWRSPVSGASVAVFAGAFEGVLARRLATVGDAPARRWVQWGTPVGISLCCVAIAAVTFLSQCKLLQARGAVVWQANEQAIALYRDAARFAPWSWIPPYEHGKLLLTRSDFEGAVREFDRTIVLHPAFVPAMIGGARADVMRAQAAPAHLREEIIQGAETRIEAAIPLAPDLSDTYEIRANIALVRASTPWDNDRRAQLTRAVQLFQQAIAAGSPDTARLFHVAGLTAAELGDNENAQMLLQQAIAAGASEDFVFDAYLQLAVARGALNDAGAFLGRRWKQLESDPAVSASVKSVVGAYYAAAHARAGAPIDDVLNQFDAAVTADPVNARAWELYYEACAANDEMNRMKDAFARANPLSLQHDRPVPVVLQAIAQVWTVMPPDWNGAINTLASALESADAYRPAAEDLRLGWAAQIIADAIANAGTEVEIDARINAAIVLSRTGQYRAALAAFDAIASDIPTAAEHDVALERIYAVIGSNDAATAEKEIRSALTKFPNDPAFGVALARALVRQGKLDEARFEYAMLRTAAGPGSSLAEQMQRDLQELGPQR